MSCPGLVALQCNGDSISPQKHFFSLLDIGFNISELLYLLLTYLWTIESVCFHLVWALYSMPEADNFSWPCSSHTRNSSPSFWGRLLRSVWPGCCSSRHFACSPGWWDARQLQTSQVSVSPVLRPGRRLTHGQADLIPHS